MKNKCNNQNKYQQTQALHSLDNVLFISVVKVILGVFTLFASAQIEIPIKPISITLQTVVVSAIGLSYSPRLSFITLLSYLGLGFLGAPIFMKYGSGIGYFSGVTAGYLLGFLIAAPAISYFKYFYSNKFLGVMYCCLIGQAIIYALGISWLATIIGWEKAIYGGFLVYIPSGIVKMVILSYIYSYIKK
jgi:biotin transport system substrate-specific component